MTLSTIDVPKTSSWPLLYAELPRWQVSRPPYFKYDEKGNLNTSPPAPDPLVELSAKASVTLGRQVMLFIGTSNELTRDSALANEAAGTGFGRVHTPTHPDQIVPVMAYPVGVQRIA